MNYIVENALGSVDEQTVENISQANIRVIGCGGAGNNMVGWLYRKGIKGAEIIATNTDHQHLVITGADRKFLIGKRLVMYVVLVVGSRPKVLRQRKKV